FASYPYSTPGQVDFSSSTGKVSIFYNPGQPPLEIPPGQSKYQVPTNFSCPAPCSTGATGGVLTNPNQPSQLTAYMLVNTASDLNAVGTNEACNSSLARARP